MGWIYSEHRHTGHCQGFFSAYIILTCVHIDTWRQSVYSQAEACTWFCWERNFHPQVFFFFWCCHYTVIQQSVHESFSDSRFATSSYISENLEAVDHNRQLFFHFKHLFSQLILKTIQLHRAIRTIQHHCCFYIRGHFYEVRPLSSSYKHF